MTPSTIMMIAKSVSRTSVGLFAPCSITAVMLMTSMAVTDRVRTSVP